MADYRLQLDDDSIRSLRLLLGVPVFLVVGTQFSVRGTVIRSPSFSIQIDRARWASIDCEWYETERYRIDYWQLSVSETALPKWVSLNEDGAMVGLCSVFVGAASPISVIDIFESTDISTGSPKERVTYDHAIRFRRNDGVEFCIAAERSIANGLEFSLDPEAIQSMTKDCRLRSTLSALEK